VLFREEVKKEQNQILGNDLTMTAIRAWMGNNDVRDGIINKAPEY